MDLKQGKMFSNELLEEVRSKFHYIEKDHLSRSRLFFDNAGGSFRLKRASDVFKEVDSICDCPERYHDNAIYLQNIISKAENDIRSMLNAESGSIYMSLTASMIIFDVTGVIAENIEGNNIVTTNIEHPSAYDACEYYAKKTGKELRVAKANPQTGRVDVDEIIKLIDENTCLLSVIMASNISGSINDIKTIVEESRKKKKDLHIITDAVQHMPHGSIDVDDLGVDAVNFAPYKFFGIRGSGIGWISERVAKLPHHKLIAKEPGEWNLGSPAPAHYAAISEVFEYVKWIGKKHTDQNDDQSLFIAGINAIKAQECALLEILLDGTDKVEGLRKMEGVKVYIDTEDLTQRDLIIAMDIEGIRPSDAVKRYGEKSVTVYERVQESLYSKRIVNALNLKGAIRVSPLHCNNIDEIERFLRITKEIVEEVKQEVK